MTTAIASLKPSSAKNALARSTSRTTIVRWSKCVGMDSNPLIRSSSFPLDVFQPDPMPRAQALAGLLDSLQKTRIILQPIFEPILLGLETDQQPGSPALAPNTLPLPPDL